MASINRVNGMVSGFDTEALVKSLMNFEKTKTNKVLRDKQTVNWQKDAYKEMMSLLRGFQSEYLDVLKPSSNLRSKTAFNVFTASAKVNGADTSKVSVTTSASSAQGTITIDSITELATKDTWNSTESVKALTGTSVDFGTITGDNTFSVTLDGTTKSISLSGGTYASLDALTTELNTQLENTFGPGRITVSNDGAALSIVSPGHTVTLSGDATNVGNLGFAVGDSNVLNTGSSLATAFGISGSTTLSINGKTIELAETDTILTMTQKINGSGAGVTISYSSLTNGFSMKANKEGLANVITMDDAGTRDFFSANMKISEGGHVLGQDAVFSINGLATTRSENTFTIDGTTIQLKEKSTTDPISITLTPNTTAVKDTIVKFVNQYNELVEKINGKVNETKYRDFTPLTDEEKEDMSESQIKLWEEKAKSGLLKSDSILTNLMSQMRTIFSDSVSGSGITLQEMGITTSANYKDNGKLVIDETMLNKALASNATEITAFFTNESSYKYGDTANRGTRYAENGLAARINDLLNDNIRFTMNENGKKGLLVEKAGYEKSSTDTTSDLAKKIKEMESRYAVLLDRMNDTEARYYSKFTAMESALQKMNAQSSSLSSMFSSS